MMLKKILFLTVGLLNCFHVAAAEVVDNEKELESQSMVQDTKAPLIELLQIVPLGVMLEGQLENLKSDFTHEIDASGLNAQYAVFEEKLKHLQQRIDRTGELKENNYAENFRLKKEIIATQIAIKKAMEPLDSTIRKLDEKNKEWLEIKEKWLANQTLFIEKQGINELSNILVDKDKTIESAFQFIQRNINTALLLQVKGSQLLSQADQLTRKINNDIIKTRNKYINNHSSSIFSADFYHQFNLVLWQTVLERLEVFSWPTQEVFFDHGYFSSLIFFSYIAFLVLIFRNKTELEASEHLNFIAKRPISFLTFLMTLIVGLFLNINGAPEVNQLINKVIGGVAVLRVLAMFVKSKWHIQACYWVLISYTFVLILLSIGIPYPILRLTFIALTLFAFIACIQRLQREKNNPNTDVNLWLIKIEILICVVILLAELWGQVKISSLIFISLLKLLSLFIPMVLFSRIIEKAINWVFFSSRVWEIKLMRNEAQVLVGKVTFFANLIIVYYLFLPSALSVLNFYDNFYQSYKELNNIGFYIGSQWIAINTLVASFAVIYLTLLISKIFPMVCLDEAVIGKKLERGVRISMSRLIQYSIVFIGFVLALSSFGIDMAQLTIIFGALSVGIGFGLQGISNDFISGLILLFERPLREGDIIEVNNLHARIKSIGLRSTVAVTYEEAEIIIPNGSLIASQVTNWTLSNKEVRITMSVGVVYDSDVQLVIETLNKCSQVDSKVLKTPAPSVMLVSFGDNALMFELRVWIDDVDCKLQVRSNIYLEIEKQFREKGIEFAFPQLVVHQHEKNKKEDTNKSLSEQTLSPKIGA